MNDPDIDAVDPVTREQALAVFTCVNSGMPGVDSYGVDDVAPSFRVVMRQGGSYNTVEKRLEALPEVHNVNFALT